MTIAGTRCVMFQTPVGRRLRLLPEQEFQELLKADALVRLGHSLWEHVDEPGEAVEEPAQTTTPVSRERKSHGGNRKQGSRRK